MQVADVVTVGAGAGGGEQVAQLLLGDPGRQAGMPTFPVSMSSFHRVVNRVSVRASRLRRSWQRAFPSGSVARPRRPRRGCGGAAAPGVEHLAGKLYDVAAIDDHGGVRQAMSMGTWRTFRRRRTCSVSPAARGPHPAS